MSKQNHKRPGCVDVFRSYLVNDASFAGDLEIPVIHPTTVVPKRIAPFSQAISAKDRNLWVHFYEDDVKFERVWNNPKRYLEILSGFEGVIAPDFSVYRDMPLVMQFWNIYRSRAIAHALQSRGVAVIPNLRFGDRRTWEACCLGISKRSVIAVGSHGNIKNVEDRRHFTDGLDYVSNRIEPCAIVFYGSTPDSILRKLQGAGIATVSFESTFSQSRKRSR